MGYNIRDHNCTTNACAFNIINGSVLAGIGVIGSILSFTAIVCLQRDIIKIPGSKKIFMINISLCDVLLGIIGVIRGLGLLSRHFLGVDDEGNFGGFCIAYTFIGSYIWDSIIITLLPLTVDRFLAIVVPFRYNQVVTPRFSRIMVIASWVPMAAVHIFYDPITYIMGTRQLHYMPEYARCVYSDLRPFLPVVSLIVPLVLIALLYIVIIGVILKNKIPIGRLILTTSAVLLTGVLVIIPQLLLETFHLHLSYEVAQIFTVTLYYSNCVFNPVIYFVANPRIVPQIVNHANVGGQEMKRRLSRARSSALNFVSRTTIAGQDIKQQINETNNSSSSCFMETN